MIAAGEGLSGDAFERQLYLIRKQASHKLRGDTSLAQAKMFYVCSLSTKVIIYKGQLTTEQVFNYFPDLADRPITPATWRWCTRGSPPTRSRRGTALSRCGS